MVYVLLTSMSHPCVMGVTMGIESDYRSKAAAHREAAQNERLQNRRAIHEHAAVRCEEMADRADKRLQLAEEREAARLQREANARLRERRRRLAGLPTSQGH